MLTRSTTCVIAAGLVLVATSVAAQPAVAESRPPDVPPELWARVPKQRPGDPFAVFTTGVEWQQLDVRVASDGALFRAGSLSIGALHFFGHADLFVTIPVVARTTNGVAGRRERLPHAVATGVRLYPWALRPGALRPFVATALEARRWGVENGLDVTQNHGSSVRLTMPIGGGVSWRTRRGVTLDAGVAYLRDTAHVPSSGLGMRALSLGGIRMTTGAKWSHGLSPSAEPDFRGSVARRLHQLQAQGVLSTFNVAVGPSARLIQARSSYLDGRRPYLRDRLLDSGFAQTSAGYYSFAHDAEVRMAFRTFASRAEAYGIDLRTRHTGWFVEGLKFLDWGFHGFVPFVGGGLGASRLTARESLVGAPLGK